MLLATVDHTANTGFDTHTWQLTRTLDTFLIRRGHWHDQVAAGRTAVAAAHRLADPFAQVRAHRNLARAYIRLGRFKAAAPPPKILATRQGPTLGTRRVRRAHAKTLATTTTADRLLHHAHLCQPPATASACPKPSPAKE